MKSELKIIIALLIVCCLQSCGTTINLNQNNMLPYGGIKLDNNYISMNIPCGGACAGPGVGASAIAYISLILVPLGIIDYPFSLVADTLTLPYIWSYQEKTRRLSGDYQGNNQFCSIFISFRINNKGKYVGYLKTENKENIVSNKNISCETCRNVLRTSWHRENAAACKRCRNVKGSWYIENDAIVFDTKHSWNNEYFMFNNRSTKLIYKGSKLRYGDTYNSSLCKKDLSLKKLGAL